MDFLNSWNPITSFPDYHGPYAVGTVDVEVPAADVPSPSAVPEGAQPTIAFRIFYPCVKPSSAELDRPVRWIPQPQRLTISALMRFLGLRERFASWASYLPQQWYYIKLRAHRNAKILDPPTRNGRWPVTVFSHGLAGSRNAYSYVCGDLASNGMIVVALDHRDGSSPIQYVRATADTEAHVVPPVKISHEPGNEVYEARDKQLRIRLWEVSMAYEVLMKIDGGEELENLDSNTSLNRKERVEVLWQFDGKMDIHRAGKVTWCGHSFGAATMTQLLKSIYYSAERPAYAGNPLITPNADAAILHQIMPESPTVLLDMWGFPLHSPQQAFLWERPLPTHAVGGPKGSNVLSVLSESFYNWQDNLNINKHIVAAPSRSRRPSAAPRISREKGKLLPAWARLRDQSPSQDSGYVSQDSRSPVRSLKRHTSRGSGLSSPSQISSIKTNTHREGHKPSGPQMFYVQRSQHFNQSDFGILFPYIARRVTKAEEPEWILAVNTRAMVQLIREAGIEVAGEDDEEIFNRDEEVWKWKRIPVEDEEDKTAAASAALAISSIRRKLSITSTKSIAGSRDGMTMGRKVVPQVEV